MYNTFILNICIKDEQKCNVRDNYFSNFIILNAAMLCMLQINLINSITAHLVSVSLFILLLL